MMPCRRVLPDFIPLDKCKELEFIHRSCGVVGYRPHVLSTTLSHLIATNCAHLIMPFVSIRDKVKEIVEESFGCEYDLFIEFTGLISWTKGATIGYHSDSNRPYLKQRHYSAVCYLNESDQDFEGGLFHFQEGEPSTVVPHVGTVVIYSADESNMHCVDEVTKGERCTMAMWFTRDSSHNEDISLIKQLTNIISDPPQFLLHDCTLSCSKTAMLSDVLLPSPASSVMYIMNGLTSFTDIDLEGCKVETTVLEPGSNICVKRLALMGFQCVFEVKGDPEDMIRAPLVLKYKGIDIPYTFRNCLHASNVIHFWRWKSQLHHCSVPSNCGFGKESNDKMKQEDHISSLKCLHSLYEWECYISSMWEKLCRSLTSWKSCAVIFESNLPNL